MDGSYAGAPLPGTESFKGTVTNPRLSRVHPVASWAFGPLDAISCCWRSLSEPPHSPEGTAGSQVCPRLTQFSGSSEDFTSWHWRSRDPPCPFTWEG